MLRPIPTVAQRPVTRGQSYQEGNRPEVMEWNGMWSDEGS